MRVVHVRTRDLDLRQDKIKLSFVRVGITLQVCTVEVIQGVSVMTGEPNYQPCTSIFQFTRNHRA